MNIAMTSAYRVIAVWIPVTVVPTSLATVAIDTFMTELSRVIRNCPEANVSRTSPAPVLTGTSVASALTGAASSPAAAPDATGSDPPTMTPPSGQPAPRRRYRRFM